jgi:hypothetical protein
MVKFRGNDVASLRRCGYAVMGFAKGARAVDAAITEQTGSGSIRGFRHFGRAERQVPDRRAASGYLTHG